MNTALSLQNDFSSVYQKEFASEKTRSDAEHKPDTEMTWETTLSSLQGITHLKKNIKLTHYWPLFQHSHNKVPAMWKFITH